MADDPILEPPPHTRHLLDIACAMLDGHGYTYQQVDPNTVFLALANPHGIYQIYITADDEKDFVRVICQYGSRVPIDRRVAVAEALTWSASPSIRWTSITTR